MKIAILGGGLTGLSCAWYLNKNKHKIVLFEKENYLGGMAAGFRPAGWDWYLERTYHHIFSSDHDILTLMEEVGFDDFFFTEPKTVSLYGERGSENNYRTFPVDTPQDFLSFPLLSLGEKIRAGSVIAFLKLTPFLSLYEKQTAKEFLIKTMGSGVWGVLWEELFRKKFGNHAGNILASFIWARIKKRTKKLGYIKEGFQKFIDYLEEKNKSQGVLIYKNTNIVSIVKKGETYEVCYLNQNNEKIKEIFEAVISTLPTPVIVRMGGSIFPEKYIKQLSTIQYLHATNLVLTTKEPFFNNEYWINVCDHKAPMMALVQHTNFIEKTNYNGDCILYIANYVEEKDPLFTKPQEWVQDLHLSYLNKLLGKKEINKSFLFRTRYAQPIFNREFIHNKPQFETSQKNFFIANLDMTYPYDRGTNYAVKLGRQVAALL